MTPYTFIELLARNHGRAWQFTLTVLKRTQAEMPTAHRLCGTASLSVGDNDEIDVYVDLVEAGTLQAFLVELSARRVEFYNTDIQGRPASLVGRVDGTDRVRIFVDDRNTLRVAVLPI